MAPSSAISSAGRTSAKGLLSDSERGAVTPDRPLPRRLRGGGLRSSSRDPRRSDPLARGQRPEQAGESRARAAEARAAARALRSRQQHRAKIRRLRSRWRCARSEQEREPEERPESGKGRHGQRALQPACHSPFRQDLARAGTDSAPRATPSCQALHQARSMSDRGCSRELAEATSAVRRAAVALGGRSRPRTVARARGPELRRRPSGPRADLVSGQREVRMVQVNRDARRRTATSRLPPEQRTPR